MRTRSTHSSDDINLKNEEMEAQDSNLAAKKVSLQEAPIGDEIDACNESGGTDMSPSRCESNELKAPTEVQGTNTTSRLI